MVGFGVAIGAGKPRAAGSFGNVCDQPFFHQQAQMVAVTLRLATSDAGLSVFLRPTHTNPPFQKDATPLYPVYHPEGPGLENRTKPVSTYGFLTEPGRAFDAVGRRWINCPQALWLCEGWSAAYFQARGRLGNCLEGNGPCRALQRLSHLQGRSCSGTPPAPATALCNTASDGTNPSGVSVSRTVRRWLFRYGTTGRRKGNGHRNGTGQSIIRR